MKWVIKLLDGNQTPNRKPFLDESSNEPSKEIIGYQYLSNNNDKNNKTSA